MYHINWCRILSINSRDEHKKYFETTTPLNNPRIRPYFFGLDTKCVTSRCIGTNYNGTRRLKNSGTIVPYRNSGFGSWTIHLRRSLMSNIIIIYRTLQLPPTQDAIVTTRPTFHFAFFFKARARNSRPKPSLSHCYWMHPPRSPTGL